MQYRVSEGTETDSLKMNAIIRTCFGVSRFREIISKDRIGSRDPGAARGSCMEELK